MVGVYFIKNNNRLSLQCALPKELDVLNHFISLI